MSDLESAYIPYLNGQMALPTPDDGKPHVWAQKGFQFHDLLDIINPLQHLPVVSAVYRWITGDSIGNLPRVIGDALYGGIPGFVSGLFGVLLKEETGKDVGEHIVATLFGDSSKASTPQTAELTTEQAAKLTHAPVETSPLAALPAIAAAAPTETPAASPPPTLPPAASTQPQILAGSPPPPATATLPPPPAVAAAPVMPDRAPIPLVRGFGMSAAAPMPATVAASAPSGDPTQGFLAQASERKRQIYGAGKPGEAGRILNPQPVPLNVPPGALPLNTRQRGMLVSAATPAPASNGPVEISQKMMDALDKYVAMQKQNLGARGSQLDVSP